MSINDFNLGLPFPDVYPKIWNSEIGPRKFMAFRNLDHFMFEVSKLTQKTDGNCDMSYADALKKLITGDSDMPAEDHESIRNLVRSNLHKRGLITEEVYENFRYTTDGTKIDVDVGKYANGEPDCVMSPSRQYIDFFYEIYISVSYPYYVTNEEIRKNAAKLLATVEELERRHIFIKIVLVLPIKNITSDDNGVINYFGAIPLFSHKAIKTAESMFSVINDRLLRKFFFAIVENLYGEKLAYGYGKPVELDGTLNIGQDLDEIELFEHIVEAVGA